MLIWMGLIISISLIFIWLAFRLNDEKKYGMSIEKCDKKSCNTCIDKEQCNMEF